MYSKNKRDVVDKEISQSALEIYSDLFAKYDCEVYKDLMDISRDDIVNFEKRLKHKNIHIYNAWMCSFGQVWTGDMKYHDITKLHNQFFTYNDTPAPKLKAVLGEDSPALQRLECVSKPLDLDMFVGSIDGELALYRYLMGSNVEFGKVLRELENNGIHLSYKDYDYSNIGNLTMNDLIYIFRRDHFISEETFNRLNSQYHETINQLVQMYNSNHPRWSRMYTEVQKEALELFKLLGYDKNAQGELIPIHDLAPYKSKSVILGENNKTTPIPQKHITQVNDYTILGLCAGDKFKVTIEEVSNSSQFWNTFGEYLKTKVSDSGLEQTYKKELSKYVEDRIKSFENDGSCM